MKMAITHIEVLNAKDAAGIVTGQLLKVVHETNCFYWVETHGGAIQYKVSKQTHRINGTQSSFIRTANQPLMNL